MQKVLGNKDFAASLLVDHTQNSRLNRVHGCITSCQKSVHVFLTQVNCPELFAAGLCSHLSLVKLYALPHERIHVAALSNRRLPHIDVHLPRHSEHPLADHVRRERAASDRGIIAAP